MVLGIQSDAGWTYTINVSYADAAGNASLGQTTVTVAPRGVLP